MAFEATRCLAFERDRHGAQLSDRLASLLEHGATISADTYQAALGLAARCRTALADCLTDVTVLLAPSAPGEAPLATEGTGDPVFNRIWTLLGVPCVNVPGMTGPNGLPVGIQLIGAANADAALYKPRSGWQKPSKTRRRSPDLTLTAAKPIRPHEPRQCQPIESAPEVCRRSARPGRPALQRRAHRRRLAAKTPSAALCET